MNIVRLHSIRFIGAILALLLGIIYLAGFIKTSLFGFFLIGSYAAVTSILIQNGKQPAKCDLCGSKSLMKVEYEHGFTNVRLILDCPRCGRVVNTAASGLPVPGREKDQS